MVLAGGPWKTYQRTGRVVKDGGTMEDGPGAKAATVGEGRRFGPRTPIVELLAAPDTANLPPSVVVLDSLPIFRQGLITTLTQEGFLIVDLANLTSSLDTGQAFVIISLRREEDWVLLKELAARFEGLGFFALLPNPDFRTYREALQAGASGVLAQEASPEEVLNAVRMALNGCILLPVEVAHAFLAPQVEMPEASIITSEEADWLRLLASGATVTQLADRIGYSERETFRCLRELYGRMGVRNRAGALILAARCGIL
jgi:DNA-binding NarL/FixJ family response regulator